MASQSSDSCRTIPPPPSARKLLQHGAFVYMRTRCPTLARLPSRRVLFFSVACAVMSRLSAFIPELQAANAKLEEAAPGAADIEELTDPDGPYISMVRLSLHADGCFSVRFAHAAFASSKAFAATPLLMRVMRAPRAIGLDTCLTDVDPSLRNWGVASSRSSQRSQRRNQR